MAKDKTVELLYKIEGLKRMCKRKTKRGSTKVRRRAERIHDSYIDDEIWRY